MKKYKTILNVLLLGVLSLSLYKCKNDRDLSPFSAEKVDVKKSILSFEERFSQTLYESETKEGFLFDERVKLIGFKTIYIPEEDRQELKRLLQNNKNIFSRQQNHFYAEDGSFFRVYFPLHTAIVSYKGENYNADEYGLVNIQNLDDMASIRIIGRKKSATVRGTGSNIILSDMIQLKQVIKPSSINAQSKLIVIDLGERSFGENGHCWSKKFSTTYGKAPRIKTMSEEEPDDDEGHVSCYVNHGSKNCSTAFSINGGRCTFSSTACMDYNGWFTDCVNGSGSAWRNFPGSDCDYAMGGGHCWSEIM